MYKLDWGREWNGLYGTSGEEKMLESCRGKGEVETGAWKKVGKIRRWKGGIFVLVRSKWRRKKRQGIRVKNNRI